MKDLGIPKTLALVEQLEAINPYLTYETVSYTHLDVYKRQGYQRTETMGERPYCSSSVGAANGRSFLNRRCSSCFLTATPVSYTHLSYQCLEGRRPAYHAGDHGSAGIRGQ